ncbi:MAG: hypothetical protein Q9219_006979 [cf. Caloplaca sp. 3 TL-2023]
MTESTSIVQQLDAQLEQLFAGWNIYSTVICIGLLTYLLYPFFFAKEPDTHPFLLARQSTPSFVRHPGESATFRSLETYHGSPLKSGLNVKDPGAPIWASGRDGDLRDIWKKAIQGPTGDDGKPTGKPGSVFVVFGKEERVKYEFGDITKEINTVGEYLSQQAAKRVAIYLPNSVEYLVTLFGKPLRPDQSPPVLMFCIASAFYGFTPILIPQDQSLEGLSKVLSATNADLLITAAGSVPLQGLLEQYPGLKQVIWVVERTSRHMDWNEVPEGVGGKAEIGVWHDIVEERRPSASSNLPAASAENAPNNITVVSKNESNRSTGFDIVEFTQEVGSEHLYTSVEASLIICQNIAAAVAAQISALPRPHRLSPSDLIVSLAPLSSIHPLTVTLAVLYSNGSLALTSVSGDKAPYEAAFRGTFPTIIITSPATIKQACKAFQDLPRGLMQRYSLWRYSTSLAAGIMPKVTGTAGKLRLIYVSETSRSLTRPLTFAEVGDMRVMTGARIAYAFTDPKVAGAVAQTNVYDYQVNEGPKEATFGGPLSSVEIKMVDANGHKNSDDIALGKLVVSGPAVAGGETVVDRFMTMTDSYTLAYA